MEALVRRILKTRRARHGLPHRPPAPPPPRPANFERPNRDASGVGQYATPIPRIGHSLASRTRGDLAKSAVSVIAGSAGDLSKSGGRVIQDLQLIATVQNRAYWK